MSGRPRRKFETGFKKQLAAQMEAGEITATQAARTHSISPHSHLLLEKTVLGRRNFPSEGPTRREKAFLKEMEQYKKLLAEAHRQIDILKKQRELNQSLNTLFYFFIPSEVDFCILSSSLVNCSK